MTPAPAPPPEYNSDSPPPYTPPTRPNTPNDINSPNYPVDSVFIHPVESPHENRPYAAILTGLRTLQYLLAVTTIAIYAPENNHTSSTQAPAKCIYVGLVAWLSGVTCLLHYLFQVKRSEWLYVWDAVVAILWLVQVGVSGSLLYPGSVGYEYRSTTVSGTRMRLGAWVSLVSLMVWVGSAAIGIPQYAARRRFEWGLEMENGGTDSGKDFWLLGKTRWVQDRCMGDLNESFKSKNRGFECELWVV